MTYANFWQRFAAAWIDFFVLLPVMLIRAWLEPTSKTAAIVLIVPVTAAYCAYTIYCHGRFGKTIGKHAMRIRVVLKTGEKMGWRATWLRNSVDLPVAFLGIISSFIALFTIPDSKYYGFSWLQLESHLKDYHPVWHGWMITFHGIWVWSEVVVMLCNKRRRAFHDFIAGTVVVAE